MATIYRIRHIASGASYVGSTVKKKQRFLTHRRELMKGVHICNGLQKLWSTDGPGAFAWEVLETCDDKDRYIREQWWIDNSNSLLNTYNFATASHHPEVIARISASNKGKHNFNHADEALQKIAEASREMWALQGDELRQAIQKGLVRSWENREASPAVRDAFDRGRLNRIGMKDTPDTIERRRQARLATEEDRRERGELYVWINDGINGRKVLATDPIPEGWSIGRQPSFGENAKTNRKGETRDSTARANMSESATGAWSDPVKREAMLSARRKFQWMTDGTTSRKLFEGETLPEGWRLGRITPWDSGRKPTRPA